MLDPLAKIYGCTERAIEACDSALSDAIPTDAGEFHSPDNVEARAQLTRARSAAVTLRDHLDGAFDFINGEAQPKETNSAEMR